MKWSIGCHISVLAFTRHIVFLLGDVVEFVSLFYDLVIMHSVGVLKPFVSFV